MNITLGTSEIFNETIDLAAMSTTFNSTSNNMNPISSENNDNETISIVMAIVVSLGLAILATALNVRYERFLERRNAERELRLQQRQQEEDMKKKKSCPIRRKRAISILLETRTLHNNGMTEGKFDIEKGEETQLPSFLEDDGENKILICEDNIECSICLETFKIGQDLSRSRTRKCEHVFHNECLSTWLMKNAGCPCCRITLIDEATLLEDTKDTLTSETDKDTDEGTGESTSMDNESISERSLIQNRSNGEVVYEFEHLE